MKLIFDSKVEVQFNQSLKESYAGSRTEYILVILITNISKNNLTMDNIERNEVKINKHIVLWKNLKTPYYLS